MRDRTVSRADAKVIAETAADLADKVLNWKARALAAEEGLRKFAGEIYASKPDDDWAGKYATLHAAASAYFCATTNRKATEAAPALRNALHAQPMVAGNTRGIRHD